jgi:DNA-binding transcriptional LysR family regulator
MQLPHLRTLVRVVDAGGVTKAADQLGLTQPAVTKQLNRLAEDVGAALVWRQGRGLRLTAAGEVLYTYARRIIKLADEAEDAVHALYRPGTGEVRVAAVSTVALTALPEILVRFSRRYPAVRVHVTIGEIQDNVDRLLSGDAALALVTVPVAHPQIVSLPLYADSVVLVASPDRAATLAVPVTGETLSSLDQISYQAPSRFRAFVDGMLEQHGVLPRVIMEFNSHDAVRQMVELGLGVAFMPESVVRRDVAEGRLAVLPVEGLEPMTRLTSLLLPETGHATPSLVQLVDTLSGLYNLPRSTWPGWLR